MPRPTLTMTEAEMIWLMGQSRGSERSISTNLGPGSARLVDIPSNEWAYDLLLDQRHREEIPTTAHYLSWQPNVPHTRAIEIALGNYAAHATKEST